jgi:hypothetical protein
LPAVFLLSRFFHIHDSIRLPAVLKARQHELRQCRTEVFTSVSYLPLS